MVSIQKKRRNFILTSGVGLFLVGCCTRDLFGFHGLPAVAVLCIMDAYALKELCKYCINSAVKMAFVIFMMMAFSSTYIAMFFNAFSKNSIINNRPAPHPYTYIINLLTEDNEIVGINTFDNQAIFESRALPSYTNAACAWIWEWGGEQMMEEYNKIFPKLIIYDPSYAVWSHPIIEYAADLHSFIEENYTSMEVLGAPTLYVRKDFYQEAYDIVDNYLEH